MKEGTITYEHEAELRTQIAKLKAACPEGAVVNVSIEKKDDLYTLSITIQVEEGQLSDTCHGIDFEQLSQGCFQRLHEALANKSWRKGQEVEVIGT
jgi:hypothetical protein